MTLYNIHTHRRQDGETSILNVSPVDYTKTDRGLVSCGVHPWYVEDNESYDLLEKIVAHPNVVAIGETGYDSLRGVLLDVQKTNFEKHIELSEKYEKPLIIHCVKAWDQLLASHKKWNPKQVWIIHGFRGKPQLMEQLKARGFMFSIGERFNEDAVCQIPMELLFCETDDSVLTIDEVYNLVATVRNADIGDFANSIEANFRRIFNMKDCL